MRLQIVMFGSLCFQVEERVSAHFRTQKCAALLAYLALHLGKPVHREMLMELLWPDCPPEAARRNLSTALWSVRQQLSEAAGVDVLEADRTTVTLRADLVGTDTRDFQQALRRAAAAAPADQVGYLTQ